MHAFPYFHLVFLVFVESLVVFFLLAMNCSAAYFAMVIAAASPLVGY